MNKARQFTGGEWRQTAALRVGLQVQNAWIVSSGPGVRVSLRGEI
jgi:hypothetical protein